MLRHPLNFLGLTLPFLCKYYDDSQTWLFQWKHLNGAVNNRERPTARGWLSWRLTLLGFVFFKSEFYSPADTPLFQPRDEMHTEFIKKSAFGGAALIWHFWNTIQVTAVNGADPPFWQQHLDLITLNRAVECQHPLLHGAATAGSPCISRWSWRGTWALNSWQQTWGQCSTWFCLPPDFKALENSLVACPCGRGLHNTYKSNI